MTRFATEVRPLLESRTEPGGLPGLKIGVTLRRSGCQALPALHARLDLGLLATCHVN